MTAKANPRTDGRTDGLMRTLRGWMGKRPENNNSSAVRHGSRPIETGHKILLAVQPSRARTRVVYHRVMMLMIAGPHISHVCNAKIG